MWEKGKCFLGGGKIWSWVSCECYLWDAFLALLMKLSLHLKIVNHFCWKPSVSEMHSERLGNVLLWALLWRPCRTLIDVRHRTFLTISEVMVFETSRSFFILKCIFFILTLLYKGSIHKPHGVVESSRGHWSHLQSWGVKPIQEVDQKAH